MDEQNIIEDTRAKSDIGETEKLVEEREKRVVNFFKNKQIWVLGVLIIAVIFGVYIRSLPMADHGGGKPGLWDITTNTWTLGPDLDPWAFERYAEIIVEQGSIPRIDMMRNVPLGFDTSYETKLLPYMIVWTYQILNLSSDSSVIYAAVIFPVIMFALTIIAFFLFVREIFIRKNRESITRANIIALISTFFMIVMPVFLSRTLAGIPEKESAGFFFIFLAFYLFLKAWKSETWKKAIIFAVSAGVATALMRLVWGGVLYLFVTIAAASLIAFILNKVHKKEIVVYSLWVIVSFVLLMLLFPAKMSFSALLTSIASGLAFLVFFIFLVHLIVWNTKLSKLKFLRDIRFNKGIISIVLAIILALILVSIFFGFDTITTMIKLVNQLAFTPTVGRWNTTVAENRQPYFTEWSSSFGPFLKNIPVLFWLFFIGSIVLFKKMLGSVRKKDAWILTGLSFSFLGLFFPDMLPIQALLMARIF